jgi:adhesin/invasin
MAGVFTFDGLGNVTANWNTSSNTTSSSVTATGTYTVTPGCLGTILLTDVSSNTKYYTAVSVFGALAANFTFSAYSATSVFNGTARTGFVNPGQAVVNAASFTASATPAGSVFTIFGSGLAPGVSQASVVPLPTTLLTTTVTVNGEPAPLFYLSPTQINAQMPEDIQPGLATVTVKYANSTSNAVAVTIPATATPGIVVYGQNQAVVVNQDSSVNAPTNPAKVGDVVVAYLTGGGPVKASGTLTTGDRSPAGLSPVTGANSITVNGKDATVTYLGLTPGSIGLYQANFKIPPLVTGNHPLVITIAGQASNKPLIAVTN